MKCYNCGELYETDNPPHGEFADRVLCRVCGARYRFDANHNMVLREDRVEAQPLGKTGFVIGRRVTVAEYLREHPVRQEYPQDVLGSTVHVTPPSRYRAGDQPLPEKNHHPSMHDLVSADMQGRKALGLERYGTVLQPFNGRSFVRDAYEETLDTAVYLRGLMMEEALAPYADLVACLRAILYASDQCNGHRTCLHSMEPWHEARRLLNRIDGGPEET